MQIGLFAPLSNPSATGAYLRALGRGAEKRGFHSIWVAEHVVLFDDYGSRYPYADSGRIPVREGTGILDPFSALSFIAAVTERIRLGTGICLVPQRNPVYTAKDVATLDWLSGGRVDFGVGIGWLAEEFAALGVPFERRAARTREYLEVMRRLWCDEHPEYDGKFYHLPTTRQYPKPVQQPHPPIHMGGNADSALRRAAHLAQGWYGFNLSPEEFGAKVERLRELLAERGRPRSEMLVTICPYLRPATMELVGQYREAGADQVLFVAATPDEASLMRALDDLAKTVIEPAHQLEGRTR